MNKLLIFTFLICALTSQVYQIHGDDYLSRIEVRTTNFNFTAGRKGNVTISLYNMGSYDITELEVQLASSVSGLSVISNNHKIFNKIAPNELGILESTIYVDQNLGTGSYTLTLSGSYVSLGRTKTLTIPVTILVNEAFKPIVKISVSNNKLNAGESTPILISLENIGGEDIEGVEAILSSNSQLISIEDVVRFNVNEIKNGSMVSKEINVKTLENTPIGAYSLNAQLYYSDKSENRFRQNINIPIEVSSSAVYTVPILTVRSLSLEPVYPGDEFSLRLEVKCEGSSTYNTRVTVSLDQSGKLYPINMTTVYVGDLNSGEKALINSDFLLDGSSHAGQIPLGVTVRYTDSKGVQGTSSEVVTIQVEDIIDFSILKDIAISAEKGKTTTLESDLILQGTGSVEFARIEILPDEHFTKVAGSSEYIGAIDPDSPVPFSLKFGVKEGAQVGDYDLKLKISYINHRNQQKSQDIKLTISVIEPIVVKNNTSDSGLWGWIRQLLGLNT